MTRIQIIMISCITLTANANHASIYFRMPEDTACFPPPLKTHSANYIIRSSTEIFQIWQ